MVLFTYRMMKYNILFKNIHSTKFTQTIILCTAEEDPLVAKVKTYSVFVFKVMFFNEKYEEGKENAHLMEGFVESYGQNFSLKTFKK